ncbi:hypothetical protein BK140_13260 [Paenibacillus macerans]|nr:hypothetical protein BK140_13260 [Paenibacillus macerans]
MQTAADKRMKSANGIAFFGEIIGGLKNACLTDKKAEDFRPPPLPAIRVAGSFGVLLILI